MDEQPQHDRPAETLVAIDLGAALDQMADAVEEHVERAAEQDIAEGLALSRHHPGDIALAVLTDRLLTHCSTLAMGVTTIPVASRPQRGAAALEVWHKLLEDGPDEGTLANWSYARRLALTARDMLDAVKKHRRAERPATFVGRETLPPVTAEQS